MKKQSSTVTTGMVFKALTLSAVMYLVTAAEGNAQTQTRMVVPVQDSTKAPQMVQYLGEQDDMLVFKVHVDNPDGKRFALSIRDQRGNHLYKETYRETSLDKFFKLPKASDKTIVFTIHQRDNDYNRSFDIDTKTHWVENVVVKRVD